MKFIVGYFLEESPDDLTEAWKLTPVPNPLNTQSQPKSVFSGPGLLSMQSYQSNLALTPIDEHIRSLTNIGQNERRTQIEADQKAAEQILEKKKKKKDTSKMEPPKTDEEQKLRKVIQHELDHYNLKKPDSPQKRAKPHSSPLLTPPSSPPSNLKSILKVPSIVPDDLPESSPLKKIMINRTSSAKLNYLLSQILDLYQQEKIIVFSDYGPMMWYLGEALELLGIEHLIYIQRLVIPPSSYLTIDASTSFPIYRHLQFKSSLSRINNGNKSRCTRIKRDGRI
jgi:hypothetical protein